MFIPDQSVGYLIVVVLPVILYYLFRFKGQAFIIYLITSVSFVSGSLELLFGINPNLIKQVLEISIYLLTFYILLISEKPKIPQLKYIIAFLLVTFISFAINDVSTIKYLLFLRKYLLIIFIIILFANIKLTTRTSFTLIKFFFAIFITQIFANLIRYPITGQTEPYIGTMSVLGGSITAIFALTGISFAFSLYLYLKKNYLLFIIVGFFLFAIIGGKRVILFFAPLLMFLIFLFYNRIHLKRFIINLKFIPILIIFSVLIIYGSLTLIPTFNPENKIGGKVDLGYTIEYVKNYLSPGVNKSGANYYGRAEAPEAVYNLLLKDYGWDKFLFGLGPGDIIMSKYTTPASYMIDRSEDITIYKYDIGYGTRSGIFFTGLQVGLIGVILFFLIVLKSLWSNPKANIEKTHFKGFKTFYLGLYGIKWIFIFDFIFYSRVFFESIPILMSVYLIQNYLRQSLQFYSSQKRVDEMYIEKKGNHKKVILRRV